MSKKTFTNKQEAIDFALNASKGSYCFHSFVQKNKRMAMQIAKKYYSKEKTIIPYYNKADKKFLVIF